MKDWYVNLGIHGVVIGIFIMATPIFWDIIWRGARDYEHISICLPGVLIQIVGLSLILLSKVIDKNLR